ncbi:Lipoprotein [Pseudomonas syringae pv. helianthi]|uniref:Lipoprotein n=2 Tax=Pseudomonas syringae group genomosp. 7 TaxID=251699 RepID=A0A0P9RXT2_9PSED|nr:Lipoprotein [Pseudomonas syringae pv. helianthi]
MGARFKGLVPAASEMARKLHPTTIRRFSVTGIWEGIMRSLVLLLALLALSGCMKVSDMGEGVREQFSDAGLLDHSDTRRTANWRVQPDSFIYIAQGAFVPPGNAYPRPNVVAEEAFKGFVEYFPMVRRARGPMGLDEAMIEARSAGAHYLLYTRFAKADDRIGNGDQWSDQEAVDRLGVDSGVIQLMLIETSTRYLIDSARIRSRGGLLTLYDKSPEDLLGPPLEDYARTLLGVER